MQSTPKVDLSKLRFEKLSRESNTGRLDCTNEDGADPFGLQVFIRDEALTYQEERRGVTHLVFHGSDLVGFVTVSMTCLGLADLGEDEKVAGALDGHTPAQEAAIPIQLGTNRWPDLIRQAAKVHLSE